jgi:hypothetical protein
VQATKLFSYFRRFFRSVKGSEFVSQKRGKKVPFFIKQKVAFSSVFMSNEHGTGHFAQKTGNMKRTIS